jgi:hypothetical protein
MKPSLRFLALLLALCGPAAALEVAGTVPAAVKGLAKADFNLSGVMVKGVAWEKGALVLPVTENKGRTYIDVKLLSRPLYAKMEVCFKTGCPKAAKAGKAPVVKIDEFRPLKSKSRVANAEVSFDGELVVTVGVMASSREPGAFWLAFPDTVGFAEETFKGAVEKTVKDAWAKKSK